MRHVRFRISVALLCASVSKTSDVRDKKLLADIKCDDNVVDEWPVSDLRGRLPLRLPLSCLQNVFSVAAQENWRVIFPTWCFGCGSSNIEAGAAREACAEKHSPC